MPFQVLRWFSGGSSVLADRLDLLLRGAGMHREGRQIRDELRAWEFSSDQTHFSAGDEVTRALNMRNKV